MKTKKSDATIFNEVLCDIEKSIVTLRNYRNESNHQRSVEYEKLYRRFEEIIKRRLNEAIV